MLGRERYYVDEGRGHDDLLRCKDCQALVLFQVITKLGCCPGTEGQACGNKRFTEIVLLNEQEMADIQSGKIDFPNRDLFLKEFAAVAGS